MVYIKRDIEEKIISLTQEYACILITGPRQVGKTTMLRQLMSQERNYVTLDDMEFYVSPQSHDSDSFGEKLRQIAAELPQWNAEWQKMDSDILKLRKRINIGASTIESVLPGILGQLGYPYYTERISGDTWLYVKLRYHRCIGIKLRPEMDMTMLADIADNIRALDEALGKMGNIYLKVRNYGNDIKWNK